MVSAIDNLLDPIGIPRLVKLKQRFERPVINDVTGEFRERLLGETEYGTVKPGKNRHCRWQPRCS